MVPEAFQIKLEPMIYPQRRPVELLRLAVKIAASAAHCTDVCASTSSLRLVSISASSKRNIAVVGGATITS